MEKLKTFQQVLDSGYSYPEIIPSDLQESINEWFQYRYVCDNDKFETFFNRVLKRDYGRYYQLLRIEPNISDYDWLVTQYHELQKTDTETRTESGTGTETGGATHSVTSTDSTTKTVTYNTATSNTNERSDNGGTTISEHILRDDDARSTRLDVTDTDTVDTTTTDTRGLERALPMSASNVATDAEGNIGALSWTTGSGQSQSTTRGRNTGTVDSTLDTTGTDNLDSETTRTESRLNSGGYSDTGAGTHTGTDTTATAGNATKTGADTTSRETEKTLTGNRDGLLREIMTGRNGQIANILDNAKNFILSTDAFTWYKNQLETCFMGVLDYE